MSWLYSQALVAEYSADTCSDGEPSAQWNVMPTPQGFWRKDKMMDASRLSQFGPTLRLLTADHGEAVLKSFLAAFPARTSPLQAQGRASQEIDQGSGLSSIESLAKYDRDSSTWRTPQLSLLGDWELYSETWPRAGLMRDGEGWAQPTLARRTKETGSGLWPTPNVPNGGRSVAHVTEWSESGRTAYHKGKKVQVGLESAVKLWTTPLADDTGHRKGKYSQGGTPLSMQAGGQLNPQWVEWLMGWPTGWTDLKPLETARFHEWQQQHSLSYQAEKDA